MLTKILIDTSSIVYGFEYRKNVFDTVSETFPGAGVYVSKGIIKELDKLSANKGAKGAAARLSRLALADNASKRLRIESSTKSGDSWIIGSAKKSDTIVITNDTALAKRLKSLNVKVFKLAKDGRLR